MYILSYKSQYKVIIAALFYLKSGLEKKKGFSISVVITAPVPVNENRIFLLIKKLS